LSLCDIVPTLHEKLYTSITRYQSNILPFFDGQSIVAFALFAPFAEVEFRNAQFIEFDTSLKALRAYAYVIPMAVRAKESFL
jgi:hypothetical protein